MAETEAQRIDRITREILSGQRTFDSLRQSLDRLAGGTVFQAYGTTTAGDQASIAAGYDAVRQRVEASFRNRGVAFNQYEPSTGGPRQIADRVQTSPGRYPGTVTRPGLRERAARMVPGGQETSQPTNNAGNQDALALIRQTLGDYDFAPHEVEQLASWAWGMITQGHGAAYVLLQLRDHPVFKSNFPEIELRQKAGLAPVSPGEIVSYRRQARQLFERYGLPKGFYDDKTDFANFIAKDISLAELSSRVVDGFVAAQQAPKEIRDTMRDYYGVQEGELAAFFLDDKKTEALVKQQFAAAQIGGTARYTGFGTIDRSRAEQLVPFVDSAQEAEQGFEMLSRSRELFNPLPGAEHAEDTVTLDEQLGATFRGDSAAQDEIARQAKRRVSPFSGGGSYTSDRAGFSGIGEAQ